jgi:hypothetical protein
VAVIFQLCRDVFFIFVSLAWRGVFAVVKPQPCEALLTLRSLLLGFGWSLLIDSSMVVIIGRNCGVFVQAQQSIAIRSFHKAFWRWQALGQHCEKCASLLRMVAS